MVRRVEGEEMKPIFCYLGLHHWKTRQHGKILDPVDSLYPNSVHLDSRDCRACGKHQVRYGERLPSSTIILWDPWFTPGVRKGKT